MENRTLGAFCGALALCVILDLSVLYALVVGLGLFVGYARRKGHGWGEIKSMALSGLGTVKNILLTFVLIGVLTGLWRVSGTLPVLLCLAGKAIRPETFLLATFLLNCGISLLMGTAFGTAATMGTVCGIMGTALGVSPVLTGGAVLSGVYFGDRCSPVSTSALLVSELTGTELFDNIRNMLRSAAVPFVFTCFIYTLLSHWAGAAGTTPDLKSIFSGAFSLSPICLLPALVLLVLAAGRKPVKLAMAASIAVAVVLALTVQQATVGQLLRSAVLGYATTEEQVGAMLNGGGIQSMLKISTVLLLSSTYAGIFAGTGLLDGVREQIGRLSRHLGAYGGILCVSLAAGAVACNQSFAVLLTDQLCDGVESDHSALALDLEDSVVVLAPLIPWSVAAAGPLATIGSPVSSVLFACFLYLLPAWHGVRTALQHSAAGSARLGRVRFGAAG